MRLTNKILKLSIGITLLYGNLLNNSEAAQGAAELAKQGVQKAIEIGQNTAAANKELAGLAEDTYKDGYCPSFRAKFLPHLFCASTQRFGQDNYKIEAAQKNQLCRNGSPITRFKNSKNSQYGGNILSKGVTKTFVGEEKKGKTREQLRGAGNAIYHPDEKYITVEGKEKISDRGVKNTEGCPNKTPGCCYKFHSSFYQENPSENRLKRLVPKQKQEFTLKLVPIQAPRAEIIHQYNVNDNCNLKTRQNIGITKKDQSKTGEIISGTKKQEFWAEMKKCCAAKGKGYTEREARCSDLAAKPTAPARPKSNTPGHGTSAGEDIPTTNRKRAIGMSKKPVPNVLSNSKRNTQP